ncbi:MAG: UDP-N-acetylmuramoyl-L-alanine--D-glutamate ligase, partial [Oscillospiraceae bacterium]
MNRTEFFENLKDKKVGIIGLGVSHFDLICLLLKKGIDVTVLDKREIAELGEQYETLNSLGAKFLLGQEYLESLADFDIVFRTPGLYFLSEKLTEARKNGVVITSEMEVFFSICPCKIYAVTGSDGKTTSTTLIGEMLKAQGKTVYVGGNIGRALLPMIEQINESDICVVEVSSFQLISMRPSPDVAVITNIAPNHLDVHKDMEEYISAKMNLIAHQNAFSRTVLNMDNEETFKLAHLVRGEDCYFSIKTAPHNGSYLDKDGYLVRVKNGVENKILHKSEIKLPGMHNVENYLCAISAVNGEVDDEAIIQVATQFGGVEHRIEYVKTIEGVRYYNDSIATSPTRTIAGLNAFDQKLIIIAGGYDKKI